MGSEATAMSWQQRDRILCMIDDPARDGATIVEGGTYDGLVARQMVITNVTPEMGQ